MTTSTVGRLRGPVGEPNPRRSTRSPQERRSCGTTIAGQERREVSGSWSGFIEWPTPPGPRLPRGLEDGVVYARAGGLGLAPQVRFASFAAQALGVWVDVRPDVDGSADRTEAERL